MATTVPLARVEGEIVHFIDRLNPHRPLHEGARCLGCGQEWAPSETDTDVLDWAMTHNTPKRQTYADRSRTLDIKVAPVMSDEGVRILGTLEAALAVCAGSNDIVHVARTAGGPDHKVYCPACDRPTPTSPIDGHPSRRTVDAHPRRSETT